MPNVNDMHGTLASIDGRLQQMIEHQRDLERIRQQERVRGEKYILLPLLNGQAVSGSLVMGGDSATAISNSSNQEPGPGPDQGYSWSLTELNIEGLATSDVVGIYRNTNGSQGRRIWILTGNQPHQTWGRGQKLLRDGDKLLVASIGTFTSTAVITLSGVARQIPGEKEFQL